MFRRYKYAENIFKRSIDMYEDIDYQKYSDVNKDNYKHKQEEVRSKLATMNRGQIAEIWEKVLSLWSFVKDPKVPTIKKIIPLAALVYLVSPLDVCPDAIPVLGLADDAAVILAAIAKVYNDLKNCGYLK